MSLGVHIVELLIVMNRVNNATQYDCDSGQLIRVYAFASQTLVVITDAIYRFATMPVCNCFGDYCISAMLVYMRTIQQHVAA